MDADPSSVTFRGENVYVLSLHLQLPWLCLNFPICKVRMLLPICHSYWEHKIPTDSERASTVPGSTIVDSFVTFMVRKRCCVSGSQAIGLVPFLLCDIPAAGTRPGDLTHKMGSPIVTIWSREEKSYYI